MNDDLAALRGEGPTVPERGRGARRHERVTITKDGRSYLVLMSAEDLESIQATLELLADAEAVRRLEQGRKDLDAGLGTSADSMAELMSVRR